MHAGESSQLRCPATKSQRFLAKLSLSVWIRQKAACPRGQEAHGRKLYNLLVLNLCTEPCCLPVSSMIVFVCYCTTPQCRPSPCHHVSNCRRHDHHHGNSSVSSRQGALGIARPPFLESLWLKSDRHIAASSACS